jgi:hypothetical protein
MQLRISLAAAAIITSMASQAEDYVSVQYLQYDESKNRTSVSAPSIMINKDFGTDYTLNASFVVDVVSGASENYYLDSVSGASAFSRGTGNASDAKYGNVEYSDERAAGSALFTTRFANRDELTLGGSYSSESDFYSTEGSLEYMHWLGSSKNQSISLGASYQFNEILDHCNGVDCSSGASQKMKANALNTQVSYSLNLNPSSYVKASLFYSNDDGYLTNPYLNIVRNYSEGAKATVIGENRPDTKTAYGVSLKYTTAITDTMSLHLGYRYYTDDWEINSHTVDTDLFYELGNDWIFNLGLRGYTQSEASFYNGEKDYFTDEVYASSDQRLSKFDAVTYKANIDYKIYDDLNFNIGAHYYDQSTGLSATYFVTGITYSF